MFNKKAQVLDLNDDILKVLFLGVLFIVFGLSLLFSKDILIDQKHSNSQIAIKTLLGDSQKKNCFLKPL